MNKKLIVKMSAKVSDLFCMSIVDSTGNTVLDDYDGYVPSFFPNEGGDYIELDIDVETGKILNWNTTVKDVMDFIKTRDDLDEE